MGAAKWGREGEFRRLFQAQMKRMTRDGLDTLVYIAIKDMTECYKAVPALALHLMKKASKDGSARLHVIRIMDAIITKSRLKHKLSDKFGGNVLHFGGYSRTLTTPEHKQGGFTVKEAQPAHCRRVPRMESAKVAQALFEHMKECGAEQKSKAAKILQVWRKNRVLSPPSQAATEDALGTDMLATSGDSAAVKAGGVSSNIISASDNETAADAHTKAVAAAVTGDIPVNMTVTSPLASSSKTAANMHNNSSDSGPKGALGTSQLVGLTSQPDGSTAQQADTSRAPEQLARTSSEEMRRSLAQLSPPPPSMQAAFATPNQERPGAPPLPPDDMVPFDSGVDAVVLASGATLTNPQLAAGKPARRSKFDRPASGGRENDPGAARDTATDRFQVQHAPPANESSAAPPGLPMLGGSGGVPGISPRAATQLRPPQPPGSDPARTHPPPNFQAPSAAPQAATPPPSSAAVPSGAPASIEVQPPPSFGEVWNPAPNSLQSATPARALQVHSASATPPPAPPTTAQPRVQAQYAHHGSATHAYDPMSAAATAHASHEHSPWSSAAAAPPARMQQPGGYQHAGPPRRASPPDAFARGHAGGPPVQLPPPRPPFQNGNMHSPATGVNAPYNPFVASSVAAHSLPPGGPPSQQTQGPPHKPPVLSPPPDSGRAAAPRGLPGPPPRAPEDASAVRQDAMGAGSRCQPGQPGSPRALPPPPPGPPGAPVNGHGSAVLGIQANGTSSPKRTDRIPSEGDEGAPRKRRKSRWDDDA